MKVTGEKTPQIHPGSIEGPLEQSSEVADPPVPAFSLSLADEAITGAPRPVPQDDSRAHQELLKWVASNLGLHAEELEETSDSLFDVLSLVAPALVPLHKVVTKITKSLWQTPSSLLPSPKGQNKSTVCLLPLQTPCPKLTGGLSH